jgi:hypothetical protein
MARLALAGLALLLLTPTPGAAQEAPLGKPSAFDLAPASERVLARAGSRLYSEPDPRAATVAILDVDTELEVIERDKEWARVRHDGRLCWFAPEGTAAAHFRPAPLDRDGATAGATLVLDLLTAVPDPAADRLAAALGHLDAISAAGRLGPFPLYTDAIDPRRIRRLQGVGDQLPAAYAERYGLAPEAAPAGAVVLYSRARDYQAFVGETQEIADLAARGHALYGIAALYAGRDATDEVMTILVHEMVHLLNRAVFHRPLPAWLEEGLANDLAWSEVGRDGRLELGSWGGSTRLTRPNSRDGTIVVEQSGAQASHRKLLEWWRQGDLAPLPELFDMSWVRFVEPQRRPVHYAQSAMLIRFLLDGENGMRAASFRDFLGEAASGSEPSPTLLESHLGRTTAELERDFGLWLTQQVAFNR